MRHYWSTSRGVSRFLVKGTRGCSGSRSGVCRGSGEGHLCFDLGFLGDLDQLVVSQCFEAILGSAKRVLAITLDAGRAACVGPGDRGRFESYHRDWRFAWLPVKSEIESRSSPFRFERLCESCRVALRLPAWR